jgi:hypothetical protein
MAISENSIVVVATGSQVSCALENETVILNFDSRAYFGLSDVGSVVWKCIQSPCKVTEIREAILREYDVGPDRCEQDLVYLLGELQNQGLVEICDEAAQ